MRLQEERIKRLKKRIAAESGYFGELPDTKFLTRAEIEAWDKEQAANKKEE